MGIQPKVTAVQCRCQAFKLRSEFNSNRAMLYLCRAAPILSAVIPAMDILGQSVPRILLQSGFRTSLAQPAIRVTVSLAKQILCKLVLLSDPPMFIVSSWYFILLTN